MSKKLTLVIEVEPRGLVVTSLLWDILSVVGFLFIGIVIFKENLNTLQTAGVILGIVALIMLSVGEVIK